MQRFRMDETRVITGVANGPRRGPFQLQDQEALVSHPARATKHAKDTWLFAFATTN